MNALVPSSDIPVRHGQDDFAFAESSPQHSTDLLALAWSGRWLILMGLMLGVAASWIALQRVTPQFTSISRIYVERRLPKLLGTELQVGQGNGYLHTQVELIKSTAVLSQVVDSPLFAGMRTFSGVDNRIGLLRSELDVGVGQDDEIINVSLELPDASEAAQLVNGIVDAYITHFAERRRNDAARELDILRPERDRREQELATARQELYAFREANPELAVQVGDQDVASDRFSRLMNELNQTELEQLTAKAEHERVQQMAASPDLRPLLIELAMESVGKANLEADLESLLDRRQEVELLLAGEQSRWGDSYPSVRSYKRTLEQIDERLAQKAEDIEVEKQAALKAYAFNVKERYEFFSSKLAELRNRYSTQFEEAKESAANNLKLAMLRDTYARAELQVDEVEQRIKELDLAEEVGAMNVSIIEVAAPAGLPSYPSRAKFMGAGVMLGSLAGFGVAWLRDLLDQRLKSVEEIEQALQLPVFGSLRRQLGKGAREEIGRLVQLQPRSVTAEAFRTLRTAVHFGLAGDDCKVLVLTSPSPGDGKSVVASNLAIATAQAGRRVLLIDADMRRPTQHAIFGVDHVIGLATALSERMPLEHAIIPNVVDSLDLLPAGACPSNPLELLNNARFAALLEQLKNRYDRVIIDSPPLLPVADSRVIAAHSDAVLLVLRAEKSTRRMSLAARNELWRVRAMRLGVVVNAVPPSKGGAYGYGAYPAYGEMAYGHGEQAAEAGGRLRLNNSRHVMPEAAAVAEEP